VPKSIRTRQLSPAATAVVLTVATLAAFAGVARAVTASVTFGPKTDYPTLGLPTAVLTGDLDHDGAPDLVVSNFDSEALSVFLGDGAGGFGTKTNFATGAGPLSAALADLNGDFDLDVAVANKSDSSMSILLGDGTGGFGSKTDFFTGSGPDGIAIGDLNGDMFPDIVTANVGDGTGQENTVSVLLGNGAGGFGAKTNFATGVDPRTVALGDVNLDSSLDVVTANYESSNVSVLLGNGHGGLGTKSDFATAPNPISVVIARLTADVPYDLAVTSIGSDNVSVLVGNGAGSFGPKTDFATGDGPDGLAAADVNNDGFTDLVVAASLAASVSVFVGDGSGTFPTRTDYPTGFIPRGVATGDFNGDAFGDLAVTNWGANTVSVLMNTTATPVAPGAPTIIRNATAGDGIATVNWTAPASDGGSPLLGYVVTPYVGYSPRPATTFNSTATTQTVTGLVNGTQYRFRVQAFNAVGTGGFSTVTNPVVPALTAPGAPTIIRNATAGDTTATVNWTAPASDGGSAILGYVVTPYVGFSPRPSTTFNSTATTQTVTGLVNGTQYRFRVQAFNAVGTGGFSTVTNPVTPSA
jgi:hypothetical protein